MSRLAPLLVAALLLGACGAGSQETAEGATGGGPGPAIAAAPAGAAEVAAPELRTTGEDFDVIWRSLVAYRAWLLRSPDPDPTLLDAIALPACPCYAEDRALLDRNRAQDLRWTGASPVIRSVEVVDDAAPDLVILRVDAIRQEPTQLVDATGAVHETIPPGEPFVTDYVLERAGEAAPWKLRSSASRAPTGDPPQ